MEGSEKPGCLILNDKHQLLFCADDGNILDRTVCTAGNRETSLVAIKVFGLEADSDKAKYMVMSGDLKGGQSYNIKPDNSSFGKMDWLKY